MCFPTDERISGAALLPPYLGSRAPTSELSALLAAFHPMKRKEGPFQGHTGAGLRKWMTRGGKKTWKEGRKGGEEKG